MNESSKAMRRRWIEHEQGVFNWRDLFHQGRGIDVGAGPDALPFPNCQGWDMEDGDANVLHEYFPASSFNWLHASQCLEHMHDPVAALRSWLKVVAPGGVLVISIPSWELYERMVWPSRFNVDHKSTWSMWQKGSPAPHHVHVPEWLRQFEDEAEALLCRLIDNNFNYSADPSGDQTWPEADGVEAFIEFVLRKKHL